MKFRKRKQSFFSKISSIIERTFVARGRNREDSTSVFSLESEKGQAFTVFRVLIAVIMGLMIFLIILGIIGHFEEQKRIISQKRLFEGFNSAFQSPNGDIIIRDNIFLESRTVITAGAFSRDTRLPVECIILRAPSTSTFTQNSSFSVTFERQANISVFYQCEKATGSSCEIDCLVSFGEPI